MLRSLVSRSGAISRAAGALSASTASAAPRGLIPRARLYSTAGGHGHHAATEEASGRRLATAALVTGSVFLGLYMSSPDASERKVARRKATPVAPAAAEEPAEEAATHVVETKVAVPEKKVEAVVVKPKAEEETVEVLLVLSDAAVEDEETGELISESSWEERRIVSVLADDGDDVVDDE